MNPALLVFFFMSSDPCSWKIIPRASGKDRKFICCSRFWPTTNTFAATEVWWWWTKFPWTDKHRRSKKLLDRFWVQKGGNRGGGGGCARPTAALTTLITERRHHPLPVQRLGKDTGNQQGIGQERRKNLDPDFFLTTEPYFPLQDTE